MLPTPEAGVIGGYIRGISLYLKGHMIRRHGFDSTRMPIGGDPLLVSATSDAARDQRPPRQNPAGDQKAPIAAGTVSADALPPASATREELERLGEEIAELSVHLDTAIYRLLVRLRDFDAREGWTGGFLSCAHWLSWRTSIAPGAAREKVRVARALGDLPRLSRAMELGELSYSKVRGLTRIATPANEEELLELARHATAAQVEAVVRAWRRADRTAEANAERERHERRHLTVYVDDDGSYVVRGRLDPEVGALFERALEQATGTLYAEEEPIDSGTEIGPAGIELSGIGLPTAAQRRADALGVLVELALSDRTPGLERAAGESPTAEPCMAEVCATQRVPHRPPAHSPRARSPLRHRRVRESAAHGARSAAAPAYRSCCTSRLRPFGRTPSPVSRCSPAASAFPRRRRAGSPAMRAAWP